MWKATPSWSISKLFEKIPKKPLRHWKKNLKTNSRFFLTDCLTQPGTLHRLHAYTKGPFFPRLVYKYFYRRRLQLSETMSVEIPFFQWVNSSCILKAKCKVSLHSVGSRYCDWRVHMLSKLHLLWHLNWASTYDYRVSVDQTEATRQANVTVLFMLAEIRYCRPQRTGCSIFTPRTLC